MNVPVQILAIIWSSILSEVCLDKINAPGCGEIGPFHGRINNGIKIDRNVAPWMVSIMSDFPLGHDPSRTAGGGSLISERYVLTAAHVLKPKTSLATYVFVRVNATYIWDVPSVEPKELILHPRYNASTVQNDIALVKLRHPVRYNEFMKPVCLPKHRLRLNNKLAAFAGWGAITDVREPTSWLHFVRLKILPFRFCPRFENTFTHKDYFTEADILCTESRGKNTCGGDSGGPLVVWNKRRHRFVEVGILSFRNALSCVNSTEPSVFTRVSTYVPWIRRMIAGAGDIRATRQHQA